MIRSSEAIREAVMNVLALDTASPDPAIALSIGARTLVEKLPPDRQASVELLPALERCLRRADTRITDFGRITVCAGPGSFTGVRVGLATAWGLAKSLGIPLESVSTLEAIAEAARTLGLSRVCTALDAGRGEVVLESFSLESPRARPLAAPTRLTRDEGIERCRTEEVVCLPADLLLPTGRALAQLIAQALTLAVARAPRAAALPTRMTAFYSRPSAAEEKHGTA